MRDEAVCARARAPVIDVCEELPASPMVQRRYPVTSTGNTVNNVAAFSQNTTAAFYVRRLSSTTCLITQH